MEDKDLKIKAALSTFYAVILFVFFIAVFIWVMTSNPYVILGFLGLIFCGFMIHSIWLDFYKKYKKEEQRKNGELY